MYIYIYIPLLYMYVYIWLGLILDAGWSIDGRAVWAAPACSVCMLLLAEVRLLVENPEWDAANVEFRRALSMRRSM